VQRILAVFTLVTLIAAIFAGQEVFKAREQQEGYR
jgi:hypothetical protein